jgi:hypothetical protein
VTVTDVVDDRRSQADKKVLEAAQQTLGLAPWHAPSDVSVHRHLGDPCDQC